MLEKDVPAIGVTEGLESLDQRTKWYLLFLGASCVPEDADSRNLPSLALSEHRT